jgi:Na+/H+ antiporter NhaD/arsenite permease-like protein
MVSRLKKLFKSKPLKVMYAVIITLFALSLMGKLFLSNDVTNSLQQFHIEIGSYALIIQLLAVAITTYIFPFICRFFLNRKLNKQSISWEDLPKENQEMLLTLQNRWIAFSLSMLLIVLVKI